METGGLSQLNVPQQNKEIFPHVMLDLFIFATVSSCDDKSLEDHESLTISKAYLSADYSLPLNQKSHIILVLEEMSGDSLSWNHNCQ